MGFFDKRLHKASLISAQAVKTFERAAVDLELAAQMNREIYDEAEKRVLELEAVKAKAEEAGRRASDRAERLRNFLL